MSYIAPTSYRQSLIARFDACPLSVRFALENQLRSPSPLAARGTLLHRFAHRAVRKMWETGEQTFPIEMGMELLADVLSQHDVPAEEVVPIPMSEMKWLRVLVTKWCEHTRLDPQRIIATEERFFADVSLRTGGSVPITGQLDLLLADPPGGLIVCDWKSGYRRPPKPRRADAANEGGGLTALGWAQWLIYSYLMFENFSTIERVVFREVHVLWGEEREARMERWEMERLSDVLTSQVGLLHQAVQEGPDSERWVASPGTQCGICPRPRDCPIRDSEGIPTTYEEAQRLAGEWVVAGAIRTERRKYLDGWIEEHGPIEIPHADGRRVVGWDYGPDGKRNFKVFEPPTTPDSPYDDLLAAGVPR